MEPNPALMEEYDKGINAIEKKDYQRAIVHFTNALNISDRNGLFNLHRGECYFKMNNYVAAKNDFEKGIQKLKSFLYQTRGTYDTKTRDSFICQIIEGLVYLGLIENKEEHLPEALTYYTEAIAFYYQMVYYEVLPAHLRVSEIFMKRGQVLAKANLIEKSMKDMGYAMAEASGESKDKIVTIARMSGHWEIIDKTCRMFSQIHPPDRWEYIKTAIRD